MKKPNLKKFKDSREFIYLSDVYLYIEQFGKKGHQIGRKIGDMLELLVMGYCLRSDSLKKCMKTELALEGFTEGKHKVEFSFFKLDEDGNFIVNKNNVIDQKNLIGFIECKRVGVEVTVHPQTRMNSLKLGKGDIFNHNIKPRWLDREIQLLIKVLDIDKDFIEMSIISKNSNSVLKSTQKRNLINQKFKLPLSGRFLIVLIENGTIIIIPHDKKLCEIKNKVRLCHVFTLKKIDNKAHFKIETCLTGLQTIEKAKQSALVALDVRKKILGKWGIEKKTNSDNLTSILVIGEVSHWEDKSKKVVKKTIDYNLVVPDNILIQMFKRFYKEFGDDFLQYINKNELKTNNKVRKLIDDVITKNNEEIFYDLEDFKFKKIIKKDNSLGVTDL